jgi:hypothetical protein
MTLRIGVASWGMTLLGMLGLAGGCGPGELGDACASNDDCGDGLRCDGRPDKTLTCMLSECESDASCSAGMRCVEMLTDCYGIFACESAGDQCSSQADCADGNSCLYSADTQVRTCRVEGCGVGRPFLIEERARTADAAARVDWRDDGVAVRMPASAEERERLARRWTEVALAEHASIAAFARFALQLLALGAPAALVSSTNEALADETRHAKVCFDLASRYAGRDIGPGPLDVSGALDGADKEHVLRTAFREGCVGESLAALEALEAAEHATDPAVAMILRGIAADETRHAALAWRFVAWMLETEGEWAVEVVRAEVGLETPVEADGMLDRGRRALIRRAAMRDVIGPVAGRLLALRRAA